MTIKIVLLAGFLTVSSCGQDDKKGNSNQVNPKGDEKNPPVEPRKSRSDILDGCYRIRDHTGGGWEETTFRFEGGRFEKNFARYQSGKLVDKFHELGSYVVDDTLDHAVLVIEESNHPNAPPEIAIDFTVTELGLEISGILFSRIDCSRSFEK